MSTFDQTPNGQRGRRMASHQSKEVRVIPGASGENPLIGALMVPMPASQLAEHPMFARIALEDDRRAVLDMAGAQYAEHKQTFPSIDFDRETADATFSAYLEGADPTIFVVEWRRQVVGFLVASIQPLRFGRGFCAQFESSYVRPDVRLTRASALLVEAFHQWSHVIAAQCATGVGMPAAKQKGA